MIVRTRENPDSWCLLLTVSDGDLSRSVIQPPTYINILVVVVAGGGGGGGSGGGPGRTWWRTWWLPTIHTLYII